ncbi:MAG: hypothetical protein E5W82_09410 [Mesorhizobium sp.]|nr:MAG: hypothetical protein E5W82_09410 [Mesorhizobium sp.]
MTSKSARIRQLLLVALIAPYPGEKLSALKRLRHTLQAMGRDEHWLADRLQFEEDPFEEIARRRFDRAWDKGWPR